MEEGLKTISEKEFHFHLQSPYPYFINRDFDFDISPYLRNLFKQIIFKNCRFSVSHDFTSAILGKPSFEDCIFDEDVLGISGYMFLNKCTFRRNLELTLIEGNSSKISNLNVDGTLEITGVGTGLAIKNINEVRHSKEQRIVISAKIKTLHIEVINVCDIAIESPQVLSSIFIEGANFDYFLFNLCLVSDRVTFRKCFGGTIDFSVLPNLFQKLEIAQTELGTCTIALDRQVEVSILTSEFGCLFLHGQIGKEGKFSIMDKSLVNDLRLLGVINQGQVLFNALTVNRVFSLVSTNLRSADFINCNFLKSSFEFENSKVSEIFTAGTLFPKHVFVNQVPSPKQARLAFGQLAIAAQKHGDNINHLEYSSRELHAHFQTLKWRSRRFFEWLNLCLNWMSNDFGRDWVRGGMFSVIVGFIFFILLLLSTNEFAFGWPSFHPELVPAYVKFMNPLRFYELDSLFKESNSQQAISLTWWSFLIDFFGRVFIAYGYYQTIQAFRRHGKK